MKRTIYSTVSAIALFAAAPALADSNTSTVTQPGIESQAFVTQMGKTSTSDVTQKGADNYATVSQGAGNTDAELRAKGICVTAVCPGFTLTEFATANGTQEIMDKANRKLFQTAEEVVRIAIAANEKGRVVVVPGIHNKIAAALMRYLPEPLVSAVIRSGSKKYRLET